MVPAVPNLRKGLSNWFKAKKYKRCAIIALLSVQFILYLSKSEDGVTISIDTYSQQRMAPHNAANTGEGDTNVPPALLPDGFPRVVIAQSCSGSSATMQVTQEILEAHGYKVYHGGEPILEQRPHIMVKAKRRLEEKTGRKPSKGELLAEALLVLNERAIQYQSILLFKIKSVNYEVLETLEELGTKFAFTYRSNLLDRAICATKDCFESDLGHVVSLNGTKVNACFERRQHSSIKNMVHFTSSEALLTQMQNWKNLQLERRRNYERLRNIANFTEYEHLFRFEYTASDDAFDDAVKVWCAFLKTFGEIKQSVVRKVLISYKNSRQPRPSFNETIYNFDKLKGSLNESSFREYLLE